MLTSMIFFTGCGSRNQLDLKKNTKPSVAVDGGQLIYGSQYEPNTLNPYLSDMLACAELSRIIFSGLFIMDDKGNWIADLAREVPTIANGGISPDGLTVTYHLKNNILWHDGAPFTARDVVFTWQAIQKIPDKILSKEGYNRIAEITAPDAHTVVLRFREVYAPFLKLFPYILPEHLAAKYNDITKAEFNRAPVGTGPFVFKKWTVADSIVLEANRRYYKGKPKLDSLVYKFVPDQKILLAQLKSEQIHLSSNMSINQIEQVKAISNVKSVVSSSMVWEHLDLNLDNPLFKDVKVRQAIKYAIDRKAIVEKVLRNNAFITNTDQWAFSWANNPDKKLSGRDISHVQQLLTQAGWKEGSDGIYQKDGKKLSFTVATTAGDNLRSNVVQAIAQQLKDAGINVEVQFYDSQRFFTEVLRYRNFEVAMFAWVAGVDPDNSILWHSKNVPSIYNGYAGKNYSGWKNPNVDLLLSQAQTVDLDKRRQLYFAVQDFMTAECPSIPLFYYANLNAVSNSIVNFKPNPTLYSNFWNVWEWGFSG